MSLSDDATRFITIAVRAFGTSIRSQQGFEDSDQLEAVGCMVLQQIFGDRTRQNDLDKQLTALARDPEDQAAQDGLEGLVSAALQDDPAVSDAVLETLAALYRRRAEAGSTQDMTQLGDLLRQAGDFDGAKAAYQQAIDAGRTASLIDMAQLLRISDAEAAREYLEQAISVGDPDLTAKALVTLGLVLERSEPDAAESALLMAIQANHPEWSPAAMTSLGHLRSRLRDDDGALAAYQQAIGTGHREWSAEARISLADMLRERGDRAGAREQYQRLFETGDEQLSAAALDSLTEQLRADGDLDGLRALHQSAVQTKNWPAPEVLVAIGDLLDERGDAVGAREAYQQAIDAGSDLADYLIERLHLSPKPSTADLDELPPQFDPRNMASTGLEVLSSGLPELPEPLTYLMAIPVAYWTTKRRAVVLFLKFERHGRQHVPGALHITYSRRGARWAADRHLAGSGFGLDPIARPGSHRDLGGRAMVTSGGTNTITHGHASPAVKYVAVIRDGREDVRPLESHFGAWVICTEKAPPFEVEGRDADGNVLAHISYE